MTPNSEYRSQGTNDPCWHFDHIAYIPWTGNKSMPLQHDWCFSRPPASDSSKILSKQPLQHTGIDHKATCRVFDGIFQPGLNGISTRLTWTMQDTDTDWSRKHSANTKLNSILWSQAARPWSALHWNPFEASRQGVGCEPRLGATGKTSSQHVSEKISESAIKLVCTNSNRHPRQGTGVQNQQAVNVLSPLKVGNIDHQHIWCQSLRQLTQRLKNNKLNDSEKIKIVLWSSCWAPQADIQSFDNQSFMRWGKTDWHNWTGTKSDTRSQKKNTLLRV